MEDFFRLASISDLTSLRIVSFRAKPCCHKIELCRKSSSALFRSDHEEAIDKIMAKAESGKGEAVLAAAEFGVEVAKEIIDAIWSLTGMSDKPYKYGLEFDTTKDFPQTFDGADGDTIRITRRKNDGKNLKQVNVTLKSQVDWWKAVTLHTSENTFDQEVVFTVGPDRKIDQIVLTYHRMVDRYVVLSKAKAFGAHSNMYLIRNSFNMTPDYDWEIEWLKD